MHDAHIRFGLRRGADVICEKPLVLNPWNVETLEETEKETNNKVYTILQLRLHPSVIELKEMVSKADKTKRFDIHLKYKTSRGNWYRFSWKGDTNKSGGIATNIGIHFFDMLIWIFGDVIENEVKYHETNRAMGFLKLKQANVNWHLSICEDDLPADTKKADKRTFRSILIDGQEFEFSEGFTDLHTACYQKILMDEGFQIQENRKAIELVHQIRNFKTGYNLAVTSQ